MNPKSIIAVVALIALLSVSIRVSTADVQIPDRSLVRATVVGVERKQDHVEIVMRVVHVYTGSVAKCDEKFSATGAIDERDLDGDLVWPLPTVDEEGIWVVQALNGTLFSTPKDRHFCGAFPARKGVTPRYEHAKELADAAEAVSRADPTDVKKLLGTYLHSPITEVSFWSVGVLGNESPELLLGLSKEPASVKGLPLGAQLGLDEQLEKIDGIKWKQSETRKQLLEQWSQANPDDFDAKLISGRLNVASQTSDDSDRVLIEAMSQTALNPKFSREDRRIVVHALGIRSRKAGEKSDSFRALRTLGAKLTDPVLSGEANYWITHSSPGK